MVGEKTYTHQSIANAVLDQGIDTMFGVMGDANLFMVNHYVRDGGGNFVPTAHEGSAVLMAQAYAHVSGKVGAATVTHGPGLTNCVTALMEGGRGRSPMVLLTGDTAMTNPESMQNIDQRELANMTDAGFEQMRSPQTAAKDVANAFYRARLERRPIVLNMPIDFMWEETNHEKVVLKVFDTPAYVPEGDVMDQAIGMVASARRPVILAGAGAVGARDKLIRLAERMEAPLATTLKAKGLFTGHPSNMDIFGTLSTPAGYEVIGTSDCVIAFGSSLNSFTTDQGRLLKGKNVVQINSDPSSIGDHFHPDAALIADAGLTADNIVHWLDEAEIAPTGFAKELDPASLTAHPPGDPDDAKPGYVNYAYALDRLESALPENRILAADGGRFMTEVWCRISATDPKSFLYTVNFAAIGLGLQEAIGAGLAAPDRPVAVFVGDGGFMMGGLAEFNTAVRSKLDFIVVVCNDAAYGAEHIQFTDRGMDPGMSQFDWPSFADVATALGGHGVRVTSKQDLDVALEAIGTRDRPLLIELVLDPDAVPPMRK
ncbi:MAG: thiamine pyrophosphate-binding protein [Pseudomonadota bacterium]